MSNNRLLFGITTGIVILLLIVLVVGGFLLHQRLQKVEDQVAILKADLAQISPLRIAVMDIQRIIDESPRALEYQTRLDQEGLRIDEEFTQRIQEATEEERQVFQQEAYEEYVKVKEQLERTLNMEIQQAVEEVLQNQDIDIVFYKQGVRSGGLDITDQIILQLQ